MKRTPQLSLAAATLAGLGIAPCANAAIISGHTATASSTIGAPFDRGILRGVDDSGLSPGDGSLTTPDQSHTGVPDGSMWLSSGTAFGGADLNPTYTVDLGAVYGVTGIRIWNYNEDSGNPAAFTRRGIQSTNVLVSLDNINYLPLGLFTIAQAPGTNTYTGDFVNVLALNGGSPLTFRYFQLDIQSNWGGDNNFYGLSEIKFEAIPEPGSTAFFGLAVSGLLARRRRQGN